MPLEKVGVFFSVICSFSAFNISHSSCHTNIMERRKIIQRLGYCLAGFGDPVPSQGLCVTSGDICPVPAFISWLGYSPGGSCVLVSLCGSGG